jgi:anti-sigma factor RsiW
MKRNPSDDELLRSYFLGEMSQEEAEELEKRFGDDELFKLAEAIESDLLAAAARGELAPAERERVLKRLASSPQGRERLAFLRALNKAADEEKHATPKVVRFPDRAPASRRVAQWVIALAASLLVITGLIWYEISKQNSIEAQLPAGQQAQGQSNVVLPKSPEEQPVAGPVRPVPAVPDQMAGKEERPVPETVKPIGRVLLQLALAEQRDGAVAGLLKTLHMTPDIGVVELQLNVAGFEELESFNVALRNKEQNTIWQKNGLKPRSLNGGLALVLEVPAEKLAAAGRYEVHIQGVPAEGETEELSLEFEVVTNEKP